MEILDGKQSKLTLICSQNEKEKTTGDTASELMTMSFEILNKHVSKLRNKSKLNRHDIKLLEISLNSTNDFFRE